MAERMDEGTEAEAEIDAPKLTVRQERFSQAYVECGIAAEAYRRAYDVTGWTDKSVWEKASHLLATGKVKARVEQLKADALARHQVTADRTIAELGKLAFANMRDYVTVQSDGSAYVDLSAVTDEQFSAISEIVVDEYVEGRGEAARNVKRVKVKLSDKRGALADISRILGLFIDKHELTGKDGAPLMPETPTRDMARAVLDILRTARLSDQSDQLAPEAAVDLDADDEPGGALLRQPESAAGVVPSPAAPVQRFNLETGELE